jgi:hypothetical protein
VQPRPSDMLAQESDEASSSSNMKVWWEWTKSSLSHMIVCIIF